MNLDMTVWWNSILIMGTCIPSPSTWFCPWWLLAPPRIHPLAGPEWIHTSSYPHDVPKTQHHTTVDTTLRVEPSAGQNLIWGQQFSPCFSQLTCIRCTTIAQLCCPPVEVASVSKWISGKLGHVTRLSGPFVNSQRSWKQVLLYIFCTLLSIQ